MTSMSNGFKIGSFDKQHINNQQQNQSNNARCITKMKTKRALSGSRSRVQLVRIIVGYAAIASFVGCVNERPVFDTSLGRIVLDAQSVPCNGDTCNWRDSSWVSRTAKPAMERLITLARDRFDCAYGFVGFMSNDSDQGSHMIGFDCGEKHMPASYAVSRASTRYCATTSDRSILEFSSPNDHASANVLWYYFERHKGSLGLMRSHGNALRACPVSCGPDTVELLLDSSSGKSILMTKFVSNDVLVDQCIHPTYAESSKLWNEYLKSGWHAIDGPPVLVREAFLALTPFEVTLNRNHICSLVVNPKDGEPDFHDSLWSGFTIEPIVNLLKASYPEGSAHLRLRASPSIPYMTLRPVLRSLLWPGFDTIALSISDSSPEYPLLVHDPVFDEHDPPLPLHIYMEIKEIEIGIDSVWTYSTGLEDDGRHVGTTRSYPVSWIANPARSSEILSVLLQTPPVTRFLIFTPAPLTRASTILALREQMHKLDTALPVFIQSGF